MRSCRAHFPSPATTRLCSRQRQHICLLRQHQSGLHCCAHPCENGVHCCHRLYSKGLHGVCHQDVKPGASSRHLRRQHPEAFQHASLHAPLCSHLVHPVPVVDCHHCLHRREALQRTEWYSASSESSLGPHHRHCAFCSSWSARVACGVEHFCAHRCEWEKLAVLGHAVLLPTPQHLRRQQQSQGYGPWKVHPVRAPMLSRAPARAMF